MKIVKQFAAVFDRSDRKFKPFSDESSHDFERRVTGLDTVSTTCDSGWVLREPPNW
jgi:hypothetical protein